MTLHKAIIKLSYSCNNNCFFCHALPKKSVKQLSIDNIKDKINFLSEKEVSCVLFSGGEPTLRNDLFDILEYAKLKGFSTGLITNSRMLSSSSFVNMLISKGLKYIYTTLLSSKEKIHNKITRDNSFDQTIKGIENAVEAGFYVMVNVVLVRDNLNLIQEIIDLVNAIGVSSIKLSFVEPISKHDMDYTPDIEIASKKVKEAIDNNLGVNIGWDGFPLCLMKSYEDKLNNLRTNDIGLISEVSENEFYPVDEGNKIKKECCNNCKRNYSCEGIYEIYNITRSPVLYPY